MGPMGPQELMRTTEPKGAMGPMGSMGPMGPMGPIGPMGPMGPMGPQRDPRGHGTHGILETQGGHDVSRARGMCIYSIQRAAKLRPRHRAMNVCT